jgi:hypothetical protein
MRLHNENAGVAVKARAGHLARARPSPTRAPGGRALRQGRERMVFRTFPRRPSAIHEASGGFLCWLDTAALLGII